MRAADLEMLSTEQLIELFLAISLAEEDELLYSNDESRGFNKLFREEQAVVDELQRRPGDQRSVLLTLYNHQNTWVRHNAAVNSLVLAPEEGRKVLQEIADSGELPYSAEASVTIDALNNGTFVPD